MKSRVSPLACKSATDPGRLMGVFGLLLLFLAVASTRTMAQVADGTHVTQTPIPVREGSAQLVEHYNPAQLLRLTVGLQLPHPDEERQFLEDLQTKDSPDFHHFLSPEEWTERFGPSQQDEQAIVDWAKSQGLTVTHRFPNRLLVDLEGPVSTIEKAFNISINLYQLDSKSFFSTDRDPEIPSQLAGIVQSIGGLNNLQVLHPLGKSKEPEFAVYASGAVAASGANGSHDGDHAKYVQAMKASQKRSSGPISNMTGGAYDPSDLYSPEAYDTNGLYQFGHCCNPLGNPSVTPPQTSIAIATAGTQKGSDMAGFEAQYPYLAYHFQQFYIDGTPACCDGEGTMDLEWSTAMSNSFGSYVDTSMVYLYDGVNANFSTFNDIWNRMLTDGLARTMSTSWGCEEVACYDPSDMNTADGIFRAMVGQGWTLIAASGDQGASAGCGDATAIQFPSSDPNVVAAGGTTLRLSSGPIYGSEVAWTGGPDGCGSNDGGSTGGYSTRFSTPGYQSSLGLPSRGVPDVALNADWYNTPQNIYFEGALQGNGGTSIVAPETAGFFANDEAYLLYLSSTISGGLCNGHSCGPLGNGNTYLYYFGENPTYPSHYPFYDITSGCNNNDVTAFFALPYYCTGRGWDPVTGWGSYNMMQLAWAINAYNAADFGPPAVSFSGPTPNTWYNSDQIVSWTVADSSSDGLPPIGVAGFTQSWDTDIADARSESTPGAGNGFYRGPQYPNATSGCLDLTGSSCAGSVGQGWHTALVRTYDNSGTTAEYSYGPIGFDTVPPVTNAGLSGTLVGGTTYKSAVKVTLAGTDPGYPTTGSGVVSTYYELNGGTWKLYSGPFTVSYTGAYTVHFYSHDKAGNNESVKSTSFTINPVLSLSPASLSFGNEVLGKISAGKVVTITNISASSVPLSSIQASGDFAMASKTCGAALTGNAHCTITVTFKPSVLGAIAGDVTVGYGAIGSPDRLGLSGTGVSPITASPASLAFGTVLVGKTSAAKTVTLKNGNPATALSISFSPSSDYSAVGSGGSPCGTTLAAGASCTIAVTFKPHQNGPTNGAVTVKDGAALSPLVVGLTGSGSGGVAPPLSFTPASLSFTNVAVGAKKAETVTVKNSSASSVKITGVSASGDYSASGCVVTLSSGASCTLTVTFAPSTSGSLEGAIALANNTSVNPEVLNAAGTAILPLAVSPTSVSFGAWTVGATSSPHTITLTNHLPAAISIAFSASGDFTAKAGGGTPCGTSLGAGASCTLFLTFSPTATGATSGVATVSYGGGYSPQEVVLSGTGQ